MSIQEILATCSFEMTTSHSPLLPTPLPSMLSQRFRRNHTFTPKSKKRTMQDMSKAKNSSEGASNLNLENSTLFQKPKADLETQAKTDEVTPAGDTTILEYTPFKLKEKSSFNPASIPERKLNRLDPLTKAKYQAYQKPTQEILNRILESEVRAKKWLTENLLKTKKEKEEAKKKWMQIHIGIEDPTDRKKGIEEAEKAKIRMKSKYAKIMNARVISLD